MASKPKKKSQVTYIQQRWPINLYVGFVPDELAWKKETKRLLGASTQYPETNGRVTFLSNDQSDTVCLVTFNVSGFLKTDPNAVIGVVVHESVHILQEIKDQMQEEATGYEWEAYTVQYITQELLNLLSAASC